MGLPEILQNNRAWSAARLETDPEFFTRLTRGQKPSLLYIGCSDSRVTAEEMMGVGPGEVFVMRNIANMVSALDLSAMAVIDYAVEQLRVDDLIVCGHYHCGGIESAMQPRDLGIINPWLRTIRDIYRIHSEELDAIEDEHQRMRRLVELNVREQCINVLKSPSVQHAYREGRLGVHGWVCDVSTGLLGPVEFDPAAELDRLTRIYRLL